ncbi:unnamed protein product [Closterium sp. Yama58-4]|nr:unnamed protein product [Closterium sp. Yama58-4]
MLALSKVRSLSTLPDSRATVPLPSRQRVPSSHCCPFSPSPVAYGTVCARAEAGAEAAGALGAQGEGMEVDGGEAGEGEGGAAAEETAEAAAEEAEEAAEAAEGEGEVEGGEEEELREVPVQFSSAEEYVDVFERLLLEECRAQILRGAEEQGRMESHLVVAVRCERANEFHMVGVASKEALVADCHDNDLLLLSKEKPWGGSALPSTYAIASVESRDTKTSLRLRLCLEDPWQWTDAGGAPTTTAAATDEDQAGGTGAGGEGAEARPAEGKGKGRRWGMRQRARANRMLSFLMGAAAAGGSACWVSKLCNTSTISREYAALRSAPSLPYIRTVLASHMPGHAQNQAGTGEAAGAGGGGGGGGGGRGRHGAGEAAAAVAGTGGVDGAPDSESQRVAAEGHQGRAVAPPPGAHPGAAWHRQDAGHPGVIECRAAWPAST